jgi:hypothetical protein
LALFSILVIFVRRRSCSKDTNKRLTKDTSPGPIAHFPLPRNSLSPENADYSGILECPCTTRIVKLLDSYRVILSGATGTTSAGTTSGGDSCPARSAVTSLEECVNGAKVTGLTPIVSFNESNAGTAPEGCTAKPVAQTAGAMPQGTGWAVTFNPGNSRRKQTTAAAAAAAAAPANTNAPLAGATFAETTNVTLSVSVQPVSDTVTITVQSPDDGNWFGVGFGATQMSDLPWTLIFDGKTGAVQERQLGTHNPGQILPATIRVLSSAVVKGVRTVVLARSVKGATVAHFDFPSTGASQLDIITGTSTAAFSTPLALSLSLSVCPQLCSPSTMFALNYVRPQLCLPSTTVCPQLSLAVDIITARGSSPKLSYHLSKQATKLTLVHPGSSASPAVVCQSADAGKNHPFLLSLFALN